MERFTIIHTKTYIIIILVILERLIVKALITSNYIIRVLI